METHYSEWTAYITGALVTLLAKLWQSVGHEMDLGKPFWPAFISWFKIESKSDAVSWVSTGAIVWLGGSVYIEKVGFPGMEMIASVPIVHSFAFFMGFVLEMTAPAFAKWFLKKIPGVQP